MLSYSVLQLLENTAQNGKQDQNTKIMYIRIKPINKDVSIFMIIDKVSFATQNDGFSHTLCRG